MDDTAFDAPIHILLVEDDPNHVELVRRALERSQGVSFRLDVTSRLKDAVTDLEQDHIDIVVADWKLPDGKGTDLIPLCEAKAPVVLMTSHGDEALAVQALKKGALDYLVKSDSAFRELPHTLRRILREWRLIQERERQNQHIRETEERLELAISGAQLGLWDWRIDTGELTVNDRWAEMLEFTRDEISNYKDQWTQLLHPDEKDDVWRSVEDHLRGETDLYTLEYRLRTKSGNWKWILTRGKIVRRDENGAPVRLAGTHLDITERKLAEHELRTALDNSNFLNKELEQFAYVAAHDLQEPLRNIVHCVQMLERQAMPEDDPGAHLTKLLVSAAKRSIILIRSLLAYSEIGKNFVMDRPISCNKIVEICKHEMRALLEENNAQVTYDPLPTVVADGGALRRIMRELIANAVKFHSDDPPKIHISAQLQGKEWVFSVTDNGIGIKPEYIGKIFLIFKRLHSADEYPGAGVGLAMVKKVIVLHGGKLWVESTPSQGSVFYFTLPVKPCVEDSDMRLTNILAVDDGMCSPHSLSDADDSRFQGTSGSVAKKNRIPTTNEARGLAVSTDRSG